MSTSKDFDNIQAAYDFFVVNSNEREVNARHIRNQINEWLENHRQTLGSTEILDFGSGDGTFSDYLLGPLGSARRLSAVEPATKYHLDATDRLQKISTLPIQLYDDVEAISNGEKFDIIIANHVFYYVQNLRAKVAKLVSLLKPGGILLVTMATDENDLIRAWKYFFSSLDMVVPYYLDSNFEEILEHLDVEVTKIPQSGDFRFPRSINNLELVLKFLLAEHAQKVGPETVNSFFGSLGTESEVAMSIYDNLYIVRKR